MIAKEKRIEKIYKTLIEFNKKSNNPNMNSFNINTKRGTAYVECRGYEIYICESIYDNSGKEKQMQWIGSLLAAAQRLKMLGADLITIEC